MSPFLEKLMDMLMTFLMKWLSDLFKKTDKKLKAQDAYEGDEEADAKTFFEQCIKDTPRVRVGRRAALRFLQTNVPATLAAGKKKLDKADAKEFKALLEQAE